MQKGADKDACKSLPKRLIGMLRANPKLEIALYAGIAVLVLLVYVAGSAGKRREAQAGGDVTVISEGAGEQEVEARLAEVLGTIRGAGKVEVMITYETGPELIPAMSVDSDSNEAETLDGEKTSTTRKITERSEPATLTGSGGNSTIILVEKKPVARGVIVVAEGAADVAVRLDLQRAVKAVLNIPLSNIEIFEMSADAAN